MVMIAEGIVKCMAVDGICDYGDSLRQTLGAPRRLLIAA